MAHLLCFSRNRSTSVEIDEQTIRSSCRLQDTLTEAFVEITVGLPDLDITSISGKLQRTYQEECLDDTEYLQKAVGVRVGPGMVEIIKGLMGDHTDCEELIFMLEECCHGVILTLTKKVLKKAPEDLEGRFEFFSKMVRDNIRLYNRCAAFAPGSRLVEGLEPPRQTPASCSYP
ncbi:MAG: hypothetical protein B6245_14510 [Desulfobacteraceae bacterium 4572_88]|nr:MAG: hypothetical protein B6245_14510 [Desulfobacteraceae bacterium 4572_88]